MEEDASRRGRGARTHRGGLGKDGDSKYPEGGTSNVCIELEDVREPKGQAAGKQTLLYPRTFRRGLLKAGGFWLR